MENFASYLANLPKTPLVEAVQSLYELETPLRNPTMGELREFIAIASETEHVMRGDWDTNREAIEHEDQTVIEQVANGNLDAVTDGKGMVIYGENEGRMYVYMLFVKPEYRRSGVATRLMNYVKSVSGGMPVALSVNNHNDIARSLYRKLGLKDDQTFGYDGYDIIEMQSPVTESSGSKIFSTIEELHGEPDRRAYSIFSSALYESTEGTIRNGSAWDDVERIHVYHAANPRMDMDIKLDSLWATRQKGSATKQDVIDRFVEDVQDFNKWLSTSDDGGAFITSAAIKFKGDSDEVTVEIPCHGTDINTSENNLYESVEKTALSPLDNVMDIDEVMLHTNFGAHGDLEYQDTDYTDRVAYVKRVIAGMQFPLRVWRALKLYPGKELRLDKDVGQYWTFNHDIFYRNKAEQWFSSGKWNVILTGTVTEDQVNWNATITALAGDYNPETGWAYQNAEFEICLKRDCIPSELEIDTDLRAIQTD